MPVHKNTLIVVDIVFGTLSVIFGTIAITTIVRYVIRSLSLGSAAPWSWTFAGMIVILLALTILTYKKIAYTPIRMLVIILIFIPLIISLLMEQTIPFPEVSFLNV
jgi:hypothetical protein